MNKLSIRKSVLALGAVATLSLVGVACGSKKTPATTVPATTVAAATTEAVATTAAATPTTEAAATTMAN